MELEAENPYDEGAEFKVTLIESPTRNGVIKNPFSANTKSSEYYDSLADFKLPSIEKQSQFKQTSKSTFESSKQKNS